MDKQKKEIEKAKDQKVKKVNIPAKGQLLENIMYLSQTL